MEATSIRSTIESVTVYRQGARIRRAAELSFDGETFPKSVRFAGLPLCLDDDSMRARIEPLERPADDAGEGLETGIKSDPPVVVDIRIALEAPEPDPALRPAEDAALTRARRQVAELVAVEKQIVDELGRLDRLELVARPAGADGDPPRSSPTSSRLELVAFRERHEQKLREESIEIRDRLASARREVEKLEDQNRRASTARQAREHELRKTVILSLRTGEDPPAPARLILEYLVPGALWAPTYSVKLNDTLTDAALTMRAIVVQDTGEDWSGVLLSLSTAEAHRWTELPELPALRIGKKQPPPMRRGWRPPPVGAEELYGDFDRAFRRAQEPEPSQDLYQESALSLSESAAVAAEPDIALDETMSEAVDDGMSIEFSEEAAGGSFSPPPPEAMPAAARASRAPVDHLEDLVEASFEDVHSSSPGLAASDAFLSYGQLRMPAPGASYRGRLTIVERREVYLELITRRNIAIDFDVQSVVAHAVMRAKKVESTQLPEGCRWGWSESYDYTFVAESRFDVPSDGQVHSIPIASHMTKAEPIFVVVPRESTDVFRSVNLTNPLNAPLMEGPIDIYVNGDFLLTARAKSTPPKGKLRLGLGVEQRIKISRNARFKEKTSGLMGGARELAHEISIEALNHTKRPVILEVRERVPTASKDQDDIKLEIREVSPPWESFEPFPSSAELPSLEGGRRWQVALEPGARQELLATYTIRIPANQELVGGNRREG